MKNFLTPKIQTSAAHSSNSIEMRPHDSQSNRENATPSSGTFTLASYKEVTPSSPGLRYISDGEHKSVEVDSPQVESRMLNYVLSSTGEMENLSRSWWKYSWTKTGSPLRPSI